MIDLQRAEAFLATHARLIDRLRAEVVLGRADSERLLPQLAAYRNPDGGFGWGLEPDLRAPGSQLAGALHAFELLEEAAPATSPMGAALCDWLARSATLPGGGVPFSLAGAATPGTAPWWAGADPSEPSLHITTAVAFHAHRAAAHDPAIAAHPWLREVTDWCLERIGELERAPSGYELMYVLQFLDAALETRPEARAELERLAALLPPSGELPVHGGVEGEKLNPLRVSPLPDRPLRALMPAGAIERDLDELEGGQREDGGWTVGFPSSSPAGEIEWRGIATLGALAALKAHGRL